MAFPVKNLLASLGLGLCMVLYGIGVWNGNSAFADGGLFGSVNPEIASGYPLAAAIGMLLGIMARIIVSISTSTSGKWSAAFVAGGAIMAAAIAIGGLWETGPVPFYAMAFFTGWTFSCSSIHWMTYVSLKSLSTRVILPLTLFCGAGGNAICCLALHIPTPLMVGGLSLLSALLVLLGRTGPQSPQTEQHAESGLEPALRRHLGAFEQFADVLICAVALQIIAPSINYLGLMDTLGPRTQSSIVCLAQLSAGLLSLLVLNLRIEPPHSTRFFQYVTPCLVLALFFVPFAGYEYTLAMLFIGSSLYFAMTDTFFRSDAIRFPRGEGLPFESFYAIGYFTLVVLNVLMENLMPRVLNTSSSTELLTVFAVFFCVYVLSMAFVIARRRRGEKPLPDPMPATMRIPESETQVHAVSAARSRSIDDAVAVVKHRHGLSDREAEILCLILHGKNVPAIAEELVLSQNTVRSHVKRIYRATDIHTRQDLIRYCESIIDIE